MAKTQKLLKPMEPGFRHVGSARCRLKVCGALPAHMQARTRELYDLWTGPNNRNRGFATTLMHSVCREADMVGYTIVLFAKPYSIITDEATGLDAGQLENWYAARFGFQVLQREPLLMARPPGATPRMLMKLNPTTKAVIESIRHD